MELKRNKLKTSMIKKSSHLVGELLSTFLFCVFCCLGASAQEGLLESSPVCRLWWTGSTYKIMQEQAVPASKSKMIALKSAKNETESFQLILTPNGDLENVSVSMSGFTNKKGKSINSENITIRKVEYVHVTKPSGRLHQVGWYPDPLPLCNAPFNAPKNRNTPIWITLKVPGGALPGKYTANVVVQSGSWKESVPVELDVWDFALPDVPFMRSGFGMSTSRIKQYHNLESDEELGQVTDLYFRSMKAYRISPYRFDALSPIKRKVKGVICSGGVFDPEEPFSGKYSYKLGANKQGRFADLVEIDPLRPYMIKWQAKAKPESDRYTVSVKCYDEKKEPIYWSLKWMKYKGNGTWRQDTMFIDTTGCFSEEDLPDYRPFPENTRYASVHFQGPPGGDLWLDEFKFVDLETGENILPCGGFEQDLSELGMEVDFTGFDKAGEKYLDGFGFSGFRFGVPGVAKREKGVCEGFVSGTAEYKKLMKLYLGKVQDHLEEKGWLGKEYLYWADEPDHEHYKYVREGMESIYEAAPKLKRFITENNPGPAIMDVTEIGCPVFCFADPEKIKKWSANGREFWSYLMCWPKEPHLNLFIDSYAINMRMWLWASYRYNLKGILIWNLNQWNGAREAAPPGMVQNIWEDPMTYKSGHGTPVGSAPEFGNGDGMLFYPPNRDPNHDKTKYMEGPVPSIRLEILRDGLDDYDYMVMLENFVDNAGAGQEKLIKKAKELLNFGEEVLVSDRVYSKDPEVLMKYRNRMGELLEEFNRPQ